jgi:hypothetical protein
MLKQPWNCPCWGYRVVQNLRLFLGSEAAAPRLYHERKRPDGALSELRSLLRFYGIGDDLRTKTLGDTYW